jgi:hypothetical protein
MKFGELFVDSLTYPLTNLRRFLILLVLLLGSFLVIPGILGYGYVLRIIKHSLKGEKGFPDFDNKWDLFSRGIDFLVVSFIYGIPSLVVFFLLFHKLSLSSVTGSIVFSSPVNMIIYLLLGFIISVVFIIGLTNMVYENRFFAAFDFKRIFHLVQMIGWKRYLSYVIVYTLIVNLISLFSLILINPFISSFGVYFLVFTGISYVFSTYKIVFGSRFKALIFPLDLKET